MSKSLSSSSSPSYTATDHHQHRTAMAPSTSGSHTAAQDKYELDTFSTTQEASALLHSSPSAPSTQQQQQQQQQQQHWSDHDHDHDHRHTYHDQVGPSFDDDNDNDNDDEYGDEYGDEEADIGSDRLVSVSSSCTPPTARLRRAGMRSKGSLSGRKVNGNARAGGAGAGTKSRSGPGSPLSFAAAAAAGRLGWLERHRVFNLGVLTAFGTVVLSIYFSIPSTLYIYLSVVFLAMPLSLAIDIRALAKGRQRSLSKGAGVGGRVLTRSRLLWILFGLTPLFLCTWHPLSLLFFPGWDPESTTASLSVLTTTGSSAGPITGLHLPPLPEPIQNRTYFFVANLYNTEAILPAWSASILRVIERVGRENVFLSIYESNSDDGTKQALAEFDQRLAQLGIAHKILMDDQSKRVGKSEGEPPGGRIEYLSMVRNTALKPLDEGLRGVVPGKNFDKVVWFNDVFMDPDEVVELLATNNGTYDQACAFDYFPLGIYDTWVTRDAFARRVKPMWPYFQELEDIAKLREGVPIEVNACWNGITAFDAKWYIDSSMEDWPRVRQLRAEAASSSASARDVDDDDDGRRELRREVQIEGEGTAVSAANSSMTSIRRGHEVQARSYDAPAHLPLRFRPSTSCIASECMLFSYDMHRLIRSLRLPVPTMLTAHTQLRPLILMNPKVGVTYDWNAWVLYRHILRWEMVRPWRVVWQDGVSHRMFGWVTDWGKKATFCKEAFGYGWVEAPVSTVEMGLPVAS
ncbi:unnamed protein product [Tilletia controversa]|nr:unnamed protein product [Tilletia controversa]